MSTARTPDGIETRKVECPVCGHTVAARRKIDGWHIWKHAKARAGTRESGYGAAIPCPGSGRLAQVDEIAVRTADAAPQDQL